MGTQAANEHHCQFLLMLKSLDALKGWLMMHLSYFPCVWTVQGGSVLQQRWTQTFLPSGNNYPEPHSRDIPALHQLNAGTGILPSTGILPCLLEAWTWTHMWHWSGFGLLPAGCLSACWCLKAGRDRGLAITAFLWEVFELMDWYNWEIGRLMLVCVWYCWICSWRALRFLFSFNKFLCVCSFLWGGQLGWVSWSCWPSHPTVARFKLWDECRAAWWNGIEALLRDVVCLLIVCRLVCCFLWGFFTLFCFLSPLVLFLSAVAFLFCFWLH